MSYQEISLALVIPPFMSRLSPRSEADEETPFLPKDYTSRIPTPLPRVQLAVLSSVWLVESIISHSVFPYIDQVLY